MVSILRKIQRLEGMKYGYFKEDTKTRGHEVWLVF